MKCYDFDLILTLFIVEGSEKFIARKRPNRPLDIREPGPVRPP